MSRVPPYLTSLRALAEQKPGLEENLFQINYLKRVEDRTAGIMASANVEDSLEFVLANQMIRLNKTDFKNLFRGDATPLGSYGAKVNLAYAMGIFGPKTRRDLDIIRGVRNAFAHGLRTLSFKSEEISIACHKITAMDRTPDLDAFKGIEQPLDTPRKKFMAAALLITGALTRSVHPNLYGDVSSMLLD